LNLAYLDRLHVQIKDAYNRLDPLQQQMKVDIRHNMKDQRSLFPKVIMEILYIMILDAFVFDHPAKKIFHMLFDEY
jgi:hypothetical protein